MLITAPVLVHLYQQEQRSVPEIAHRLQVSEHTVNYWIAKHGIRKRTISEAIYLKHNPDGDPFQIQSPKTPHDFFLLGIGLGLWWGEGTKRQQHSVRLGNTDPDLIRTFLRFLVEFCGVSRDRIKFGLQVFSDMNPEEALEFWMRSLRVQRKQFHRKVVVTKSGSIGTYREKTKHGVVTVYVGNSKLRRAIDTLMGQYAEIAQW